MKVREQNVKILKLMYVCLRCDPETAISFTKEIDRPLLEKHLMMEIYVEDLYNLGMDGKEEIKPSISQVKDALERFVYTFKYDNSRDRLGLMKHDPAAIPSIEDQKAFVKQQMEEF